MTPRARSLYQTCNCANQIVWVMAKIAIGSALLLTCAVECSVCWLLRIYLIYVSYVKYLRDGHQILDIQNDDNSEQLDGATGVI